MSKMEPHTLQNSTLFTRALLFSKFSTNLDILSSEPREEWATGTGFKAMIWKAVNRVLHSSSFGGVKGISADVDSTMVHRHEHISSPISIIDWDGMEQDEMDSDRSVF